MVMIKNLNLYKFDVGVI